MKEKVLKTLLAEKLVVIIRVKDASTIPGIVDCLESGGVGAIEITSNTPGGLQAVAELRKERPHLLVGAGTVTSSSLAQEAIDSGAQFLVTPNAKASIIDVAHDYEIPVIMGAMTPTEVVLASEAGADIIKLFPAGSLGPQFLKDLAGGPFLDTTFFAVGGVDENNVTTWIEHGASGVGVGGKLACPVHSDEEAEQLTQRVRQLVTALHPGQ